MRVLRKAAAVAAAGAILSCASTAQAQRPAHLGAGSPTGQMGVQLYDWSNYLSNGAGEITCPAPPAPPTTDCVGPPAPSNTNDRLERVFAYLQAHNAQNVELYGYPGNPFPGTNAATPNNTAGLLALRALGDKYGLRFVSRHGNINAGNWDNDIAASKLLGQEVIGAADPPSTSSLQNILNTAQLMNSLGKRSLEAGLGPVYFHNHAAIFANTVNDNGVVKSQWEALMDHTDPRYVMAQIDLFWMASGLSNDNAKMVAIYNKYANRIISFHVKDGVSPTPSAGTGNLRALGDGDVDFSTIFAAAKNKVRYYLYEYDPVTPGNNGGFNPFLTSDRSLSALKGDPAPAIGWNTPTFASAPAGTVASAANAVPIKITNIGDANLVFTNTAPSLAADADAGGNTTRDDFSIVSQDCQNKTLAPAKAAVADDPTTPDVNEAQPAVPAGSCTVNVAFKPTRTNYTSVARLQLTSNADDATERVPLIATSTGDALATVGGNVPTMLALSLPSQGGSFGTFLPTVTKTYETAVAATITSTAGDATLSVVDPSSTAPGHLVNNAFSLPSALNVRAINASNPTQAYAPLSDTASTPLSLLTYTGPVNQDPVEIGFRQQIASTDVLRSGSYGKTLTFSLSTTQP